MSFGASKQTKQYMGQEAAQAGQAGQYSQQLLNSVIPQLQGIMQGGQPMQRMLAGQFGLMDQQQNAQQQALLANPNMQRGGAMNLAFSNLARGNMMNKGLMQSQAYGNAIQLGSGMGTNLSQQAISGFGNVAQQSMQADQMKWKNIMGLGTSLASLFVPGGMFGGLLGKLGGAGSKALNVGALPPNIEPNFGGPFKI